MLEDISLKKLVLGNLTFERGAIPIANAEAPFCELAHYGDGLLLHYELR